MRRVAIKYHQDAGYGWWADSPDIPGFTAVADTLTEVRVLARDGVAFALGDEEAIVVEVGTDLSPVSRPDDSPD